MFGAGEGGKQGNRGQTFAPVRKERTDTIHGSEQGTQAARRTGWYPCLGPASR